jgi:signal peptidase I
MVSVTRAKPAAKKKRRSKRTGAAAGSQDPDLGDAGPLTRKLRAIPRLPEKGSRLRLRSHLGDVLFIALFLIIVARFVGFFLNVSTPFAVVASDSMKPTLERGDVVLWTPTRITDVKEGDVVVFISTAFERHSIPIIHRVVRVIQTATGPTLWTQGDHNPFPDQEGPSLSLERPVDQSNLLGRVLAVGGQPFKVPFLGHLWLFVIEDVLAGPVGPAAVPFGIALVAIFVAAATVTESHKQTRKERILDLILGREKIKWVVVFLTLLSLLTLVIGWPAITGKQEFRVSIGVRTWADEDADVPVSLLGQFENYSAALNVQNPGTVTVRSFVVISGEGAKFLRVQTNVVDIQGPGNTTIPLIIIVPGTTPEGVYDAHVTVYGSPHWFILPSSAISAAGNLWYDDAAYIVNFLVAFALSSILLGSYFLVLRSLEYFEPRWFKRHLERTRQPSELQLWLVGSWAAFSARVRRAWLWASGWARDIHLVKVKLTEPAFAAAATSPALILSLHGQMLAAVLLAAPFAGLVSYYVWGTRFRSQVIASGLASAMLIVVVSVIIPLASAELLARVGTAFFLALLAQTIGMALVIYALLAVPVAYLSYVVPWAVHNYRESLDPSVRVREFSDF